MCTGQKGQTRHIRRAPQHAIWVAIWVAIWPGRRAEARGTDATPRLACHVDESGAVVVEIVDPVLADAVIHDHHREGEQA